MMDINYFLDDAQNSRQGQFELDFADVIEVYDTNETILTTQDGKILSIVWDELGCFSTYRFVTDREKRVARNKKGLTIARRLGIVQFPFILMSKFGYSKYEEDEVGCWERRKYNSIGTQVYYENSYGEVNDLRKYRKR
jgi:hypothetical protein